MASLPPCNVVTEIVEDKRAIERQFGRIVRGHAYPNRSMNQTVFDVLRVSGFAYGRTNLHTGGFDLPQNWMQWKFTCRHGNPRLMELAEKFIAAPTVNRPCKLFYVFIGV